MKKIEFKSFLLVLSGIILFLVMIVTFTDFTDWQQLRGLLYPTMTSDEISGTKQNRLQVLAFKNTHLPNKEYEFDDEYNISISQIVEDFTTPGLNAGGTTPYVVESNQDMKNIILEAPPSNFVGWSGCDADTGTRCQISVTDHQRKKVEAHYSVPEPRDPLQLFSVSNNPIGGELTDEWVNANPELVYKAAYVELEGEIPPTIGSLNPRLQLTLGGNELEGPIPGEIGDLTATDYIGLQKNQLEGPIPPEVGNLSPIYFLAYMNELEQEIPEEMGDMGSRVERLELHDNNLTGTVPANLAEGINDLTPSELRLYNNQLEAAEDGLISESNIDGFNFHNNNFNVSSSMDVLWDAAERSGTYIDFCENPTDGGTIYYDIDGEIVNTNIRDAVNAALEEGWDVYIPIELRQRYRAYCHWRGGPSCSGGGSCSINTDEDGNCTGCSLSASCDPPICSNFAEPPPGSVDCARLTDPIESPEDVDPNSVGIPADGLQGLRHVYHYDSCEWWVGPGDDCRPVCDHDFSCGGCDDCPLVYDQGCYHTGDFEYESDPNDPSQDEPFRGICDTVHTLY